MLPNDYSRCADHAKCPRADSCARAEWPDTDDAFWISQAPFYAISEGLECAYYIARADAKLPDITLHDIRAMAATEADQQGIDAQRLLGHSDRRTTRIYLRDRVVPVVPGPVMKRKQA